MNNNTPGEEGQPKRQSLDSRLSQTLRNVQELLKGRSIPGKVSLTRRLEPSGNSGLPKQYQRSYSQNDAGRSNDVDNYMEGEVRNPNISDINMTVHKLRSSASNIEHAAREVKSVMGARSTGSARVLKFTKELSGQMVVIERLRELAWSGVPPYMRPDVWRLLLLLSRKRNGCLEIVVLSGSKFGLAAGNDWDLRQKERFKSIEEATQKKATIRWEMELK
ncbi:hypothetical protein V6N13_100456 [Hibiscus sabdariffa]